VEGVEDRLVKILLIINVLVCLGYLRWVSWPALVERTARRRRGKMFAAAHPTIEAYAEHCCCVGPCRFCGEGPR